MSGILIIEDDNDVTEILTENIKEIFSSLNIYSATDPVEALGLYEANKYKIKYIICDYTLPIENGKIFIDIIKEFNPLIKICVFTGNNALVKKDVENADHLFYKADGLDQVIDFLSH
jgi:DNA-binding NtrC family response regulator